MPSGAKPGRQATKNEMKKLVQVVSLVTLIGWLVGFVTLATGLTTTDYPGAYVYGGVFLWFNLAILVGEEDRRARS